LQLTHALIICPLDSGWINQLLVLRGAGEQPAPQPAQQPSTNPVAAESLLALAQHGAAPASTTQTAAPVMPTAPYVDAQGGMPFDFDFGFFPFTGETANEVDLSWWYGDLGAGLG